MSTDYRYRMWSRRNATEITGTVVATSPEEARTLLADADSILLTLEAASPRSLLERSLRLRGGRVTQSDVAWFTRQLATTERAGLPLMRSLEMVAAHRRGTPIGDVAADLARRIADGEDLGAAFTAHQAALGAVTAALVRAGAEGGLMAETFDKVATMAEAQVVLRRKVRGALAYPVVVLTVSLALTVAMLVLVVPTFRGIYAQLGGALPLPTRLLLDASRALGRWAWLAVVAVLGAVLAYRSARESGSLADVVDRLKMRLPVLGGLITKAALARVASTLAGLLDAGVTTLVALDLAGTTAGLRTLARSLDHVAEQVRNGRTLTSAFAAEGVWPPLMVQLVQTGEETGQVGALLTRWAAISQAEVTAEVERVVSLIEPLMVVAIGVLVGGIVICLYLPLFDIVNLVK